MNEKIFNTLKNFEKERTNWLRIMNERGVYIVVPTSELLAIATTYYTNHADIIRDNLIKENVSEDIIEAVINDYSAAIVGQFKISLTPQQMIELLKKVKPYKAYFWDKYVLYLGLMKFYIATLDLLREYTQVFKSSDTTIDAKNTFIEKHNTLDDAICLKFLKDIECIKITDFEGIDRQKIINWLDDMDTLADFCKYAEYYAISSLAFNATDEQLKAIHPPIPEAVEMAQKYTNEIRNFLNNQADKMAQYIEADNITDREKIKKEVENWEKKTSNDTLRLSNTLLAIQTKHVYESKDETATAIRPIELRIKEYAESNPQAKKLISPYKVEQVFQCVNYMLRFGTPTNDGYINIETNLSEFANELYGFDANSEQKEEINIALDVLDGIYIVIPYPRRVEAIRMLIIKKRVVHDSGQLDLTIGISELVKKGATQVVSLSEYEKLKKQGKGQIQNRFNSMLLNKGHKKEIDALDDIFGYKAEIDVAQRMGESDEVIRKINANQKKNLSRDKRKLENMFIKAQADGLITYTKKKTGTGKRRIPTFIYEWQRIKEPENTIEITPESNNN